MQIPDEADGIEIEMFHGFPAGDEVKLIRGVGQPMFPCGWRSKTFKKIAGGEFNPLSFVQRPQRIDCRVIPFQDMNLIALFSQSKWSVTKKRADLENLPAAQFPKVEVRGSLPEPVAMQEKILVQPVFHPCPLSQFIGKRFIFQ